MIRKIGLRVVAYALIVVFWLSILFLFLHAPRLLTEWYGGESINVITAPGFLDTTYLDEFQKETGIRVNLSHFEQSEELLVKLGVTGKSDYDLIMSASYIVPALKSAGAIQKIDKEKLLFWDRLYPAVLGHAFDPQNEYTIPYCWDVYGIAINSDAFEHDPEPSLKIIFEREHGGQRVAMFNSVRDVVAIGALYLFSRPYVENHEELERVYALLMKQKKHVAVYTEMRSDYLFMSGTITAAMVAASDVARTMDHYKSLRFLLPKEGWLVEIDSFAIPAATHKEKLVYRFLNYLYQREVMSLYVKKLGLFSAVNDVGSFHTRIPGLKPDPSLFLKFRQTTTVVRPEQLYQLWITLKS